MCMLIKDEFQRVEDTLAVCNQMSEALHDEDNKKMMRIQVMVQRVKPISYPTNVADIMA